MTPVTKKPKVIIVGAGLGGITLGILLEKAGIPYEIFERAPEVKPLGMLVDFLACEHKGRKKRWSHTIRAMIVSHMVVPPSLSIFPTIECDPWFPPN